MAAEDFDTTVERLYAGPADRFIAERDAAVKAARSAGDKDLAARIKQLRRPTAAAALINRLRRSPDHSGLDALLDLGERLREAQARLDAQAMKALSTERNSLVAELLTQLEESSDEPVSGTVREQLSDTFTAAVADAEAGRAVDSGRLVTGLRYSGFGEVDLRDALAAPLPSAADEPDDAGSPPDADGTDAEATAARERAAEQESRAAERRLADARTALHTAQAAESAAVQSAELAERALAAARKTAKSARARAEQAAATRSAAQDAVEAAERTVTRS